MRLTFSAGLLILALGLDAAVLGAQHPLLDSARTRLPTLDGDIVIGGLDSTVEVRRDRWGVPHIYARTTHDLFFAQGYVVAQDRLWQMEMWRRTVEGRLAEIVGPDAVPRDRQARLLAYRGPVDDEELRVYHPDARRLMTAFVKGVNAFIADHQDNLPVEFVITGIVPEPWTVETLIRRQITFGDATRELQLAHSVATIGVAEANRLANPDPWDHLTIPDGFNPSVVDAAAVSSARVGTRALRPAVLPGYRSDGASRDAASGDDLRPGSNNWVVGGRLSVTGKPVVANDPHREVTLPSLRYIVHLQAPGWNVIGATEPPFLSIAAGHNDHVGWGLTIVGIDQHDVYVEALNPDDPDSVRWKGTWEPLRIVREEIKVKGAAPQTVVLKFSRHGPIFHEDRARNVALALRSALHERGTAPYMAGLRLSQTRTCREFLDAATYWYAPSENLICGDVDGNISWRASALTPARKDSTGRLPVPGAGSYEWTGFRQDLPQQLNPPSGFIATANDNVQPPGYTPPFMYKDADVRFERITRLKQLLRSDRTYSLDDHQRMQLDAQSLAAAADIPLFRGWSAADAQVERARVVLASWDGIYRRDAPEPALYELWRRLPRTRTQVTDGVSRLLPRDPEETLKRAVEQLAAIQGADPTKWQWGRMHARAFRHPLAREFDLPDVERGGSNDTIAADGASFREILDVANWDRSLASNTPGQSGQPVSPYYGNLLPLWAADRYFPLVFTATAIETHARHRLTLRPN